MATFLIDGELRNGLAEPILGAALEFIARRIEAEPALVARCSRRSTAPRPYALRPGMPIERGNYCGLVPGDVLLCGVESQLLPDVEQLHSCYVITNSFRAQTVGLGKTQCHSLHCIRNPPLVQMRSSLTMTFLHHNWFVLRLASLESNELEHIRL